MNYLSKRNDIWNPLVDFRREMDSLFENFFSSSPESREIEKSWSPACDLVEEEGHYLLSLEVPGIPKEGIKVEVVNNVVTVSGERRFENKRKENGAWYGERRYGRFQRGFALPAGINADKIEAEYRDGVLHLMVPKAESAKPKQIKIGSNTGFFGKLLGDSRKREEDSSTKSKEQVVA